MSTRSLLRASALAAAALAPLGCIASSVVAPEQRMVASDPAQLAFVPADAAAIPGFHESVDIRGDAAVALRRIWYLFLADGTYTGAALAEAEGRPSFQTLNGTWSFAADGLVLDGQPPVPCEMAPGHLRLSAPNGAVVLKKGSIQ